MRRGYFVTPPLEAFLLRSGTVLDLWATSMPRYSQYECEYDTSEAEEVYADWAIVAEQFNRTARGERSSDDQ
jgi:hypothetical protein